MLAELAPSWSELFPAEQARIVPLLVERIDVQEDPLASGRRGSRAWSRNSANGMTR